MAENALLTCDLDPGHRRRGTSAVTKARILDAAQEIFASRGYAQTVLTDIADRVGISPALISRYFGSKEGLFEEAVSQCLARMPMLTSGPTELGKMAADLMNGSDVPTSRASAMLAHSIGDPRAREITRRLINQYVLVPAAGQVDDGDARAELLLMLCAGYTTMRMVLSAQHASDGGSDFLGNWLRDALQSITNRPRARQATRRGLRRTPPIGTMAAGLSPSHSS